MIYTRPPRLFLIRLDGPGDEGLEAQFNPTELEIALKAVYKDHVIPGMSHPFKQFSHTDSLGVKFDLYFQVVDAGRADPRQGAFTQDDRVRAEGFLLSLCVPRGTMDLARNRPPSVLVVWPSFFTFEAVMEDVTFKYTEFDREAVPTAFTATCSFHEIRDVRYTSAEARERGFLRAETGGAVSTPFPVPETAWKPAGEL